VAAAQGKSCKPPTKSILEHPPAPRHIPKLAALLQRRFQCVRQFLCAVGNDLTGRFPLIVETLANLRTRSCIIDGEAVACDDNGLAVFERIRYRRHDGKVFLYAFDLIDLDGDDFRREPLDLRKATLRSLLVKTGPGLRWNEHIEGDGETIFRHACKLGLEGIVSKRKDSPYRSGRSPDWLKMKNPDAAAVKREAEEDWGR
jgi:bifunctional non-homologous end joining protein LigD